ncbi:hypothetical protein N7537_009761 [Penicillium hordei]|uniref:Subtelomeric hrmA-associated cluster protein AFUB-079030/YDR124W-like helical bundle domain-containing protein n=1 Tax=Penicillium hordei TaxID=40994 RepID=A0AAD6DUW4_9EURO|nr:uncharacterized protein N7537_009761 [Penicillium hordei]KAJ5592857.1 hypothetical protein N7537_009761 [Penicillium hordei]
MVTTTRAMKRSASTLQGVPGLDVALPEMIVSRPSFLLLYTHYAMIYIDHEGRLKTYESQSIQEQDTSVFNPKVCQNFLEILGERIGRHQPIDQPLAQQGLDGDNFNGSIEMVPLRVGDTKKVMVYYEDTLKRFLQCTCRVILKAFIKFIEPRKQVKHPNNGGKPPPGSAPGTRCNPEKTKLELWPSDVKHKEPDHMVKPDRIKLFLHILRKLGGYDITADKLEKIVRDAKRDLKDPREVEIIYELLRVPKAKDLGLMLVSVEQRSTTLTTKTKDLALASAYDLPGSSSIPIPLNFEVADQQDNPDYKMRPEYTNSFLQPIPSTPMISDTPVSTQNNFSWCTSDHQHTEAQATTAAGSIQTPIKTLPSQKTTPHWQLVKVLQCTIKYLWTLQAFTIWTTTTP